MGTVWYGIPHIRTNPSFAPKQRTSRTVTTRAVSWPRGSSSSQSPRSESPWDSWALTNYLSLRGLWLELLPCGLLELLLLRGDVMPAQQSCHPSERNWLTQKMQQILQICEWILLVQFICFSNMCSSFLPHTHIIFCVCVCLMIALWANRNIIIIISSSIVVLLSLIIIIQLYSGSHLRHRKTR